MRWSFRESFTMNGGGAVVEKPLLLIIGAILSCCLIACQATTATAIEQLSPEKLAERAKAICYSDDKVQVQSIPEMTHLIAQMNMATNCRERFMSAIYELDPILKLAPEVLCDDFAFEMMKNYHFRFIQPFKRANRRPTQFEPMPRDLVKEQLHPEPRKWTVEFDEHQQVLSAPIAIRHFFLKFALQVSHQCKKNLINNLVADSERVLTEDDKEIMQMFDKDSPIGEALSSGIAGLDFDSVLHMPDLDGRLTAAGTSGEEIKAAGREQHLRTSASADSALFQMVFACKGRFKPIYDKLIMPVVRMSKLGYDYQGSEGLSERERDFLKGARMKNWLLLVHVCEIFKNTHLIQVEPKPRRKSLRERLEDIEAEEKRDREKEGVPAEIDPEEQKRLDKMHDMLADFKPLDYEPTVKNIMADTLMIQGEKQLDLELSRKEGHLSPFGLSGLLRKGSNQLLKGLAKLDLQRFAHYRRHSLFYSGFLNFLSGCSNIASITMTITVMLNG